MCCRVAIARVGISAAVSPLHVALSRELLEASPLCEHHPAAVWRPSRFGSVPRSLRLHPLQSAPGSIAEQIKLLSSQELQYLVAVWMISQSHSNEVPLSAAVCENLSTIASGTSFCLWEKEIKACRRSLFCGDHYWIINQSSTF